MCKVRDIISGKAIGRKCVKECKSCSYCIEIIKEDVVIKQK